MSEVVTGRFADAATAGAAARTLIRELRDQVDDVVVVQRRDDGALISDPALAQWSSVLGVVLSGLLALAMPEQIELELDDLTPGEAAIVVLVHGEPTEAVVESVARLTPRTTHGRLRTQPEEAPAFESGLLQPPEPAQRFANVCFVGPSRRPVQQTRPLVAATDYVLRFDIGPYNRDSIVQHAEEHPFPDELLDHDETGHQLHVAVVSSQFTVPSAVFPFFLPRKGQSEELLVAVRTPEQKGAAQLRIAVYYRNNLMQSQLVSADVVAEHGMPGRNIATVDYTLSRDLSDLDAHAPKRLNILCNEGPAGTHRLVFKDGAARTFDFTFGEGQLTGAMTDFRDTLYDIHIDKIGNSRENRLKAGNRKPRDLFQKDFERLAKQGFGQWYQLFTEADDAFHQAGQGESRVIQVARVPKSTFVFPWAALYDIPLGMGAGAGYEWCPLIAEWDGESPLCDPTVFRCPHEAEHAMSNVLCPFGFWGFRYPIEQPASTGGGALATEIRVAGQPAMVAATSLNLDADETARHLERLGSVLPQFGSRKAESFAEVERELSGAELQLVYFYCHGGNDDDGPYLDVGKGDHIYPPQLAVWHIGSWPRPHWEATQPLVIMNGCHTADMTALSPVSFVDGWARVHASGVVGTEITLEQRMAGEATEVLLEHFGADPSPGIGEAMRRMRMHFLGKGNLLGLAYTAYCSAELRLGD